MANTQLNYTLTLKDLFSKKVQGASKTVQSLDSQMNKLNRTATRVQNLFLGTAIGGAIVGFGSAILDSLKNYEYFSTSVRTLMYGDTLAAKALEGQLIKLAATTPFSLTDVQEGSKQLLAYGFSAGNVTKDLKMLGDISSGIGAPLNDIVYLYGTLKTQGRAYAKDIMQFTGRGIPIIGQLAKQFGVSSDKIQQMVTDGKVGFPEIEKAFKAMTGAGGQFFNMMDQQSKTVGGRISNLGDAWEQLKVNIGKSQTGIINSTVSFLSQMTSAMGKYFEDANKMTENFAKHGAEQFGFWAKALHETIGILSGYNLGYSKIVAQEDFQKNMDVYASPKNLQEAYSNKANLYRHSIGIDEQLRTKKIDLETAKRFQATISGALDKVNGSIKLFKTGVQTPVKDNASGSGGSAGSSTELSGARPQNINIKVDKLVETMNIQAADITGGVTEAKALTSKAFLELLNDANQMANR